jgi:hypothetical protein
VPLLPLLEVELLDEDVDDEDVDEADVLELAPDDPVDPVEEEVDEEAEVVPPSLCVWSGILLASN